MSRRSKQERGPLVLGMMTFLNVLCFWHRNLIFNLAAVVTPACVEECLGEVPFAPLCQSCETFMNSEDYDDYAEYLEACTVCRDCRQKQNNGFYNVQDGACIDDFEYGILAGLGFTVMFSFAGVFVGYLADIWNRSLLLVGATFLWSLAIGMQAFCFNFSSLLVSRILLGVGQAFNAPCAYPIIAQHFAEDTRSTANGIYAVGTYLGSAISSLSIGATLLIGWRATSLLAGLCGFVMTAVLYCSYRTENKPNSNTMRNSSSNSNMCVGVYEKQVLSSSSVCGGHSSSDGVLMIPHHMRPTTPDQISSCQSDPTHSSMNSMNEKAESDDGPPPPPDQGIMAPLPAAHCGSAPTSNRSGNNVTLIAAVKIVFASSSVIIFFCATSMRMVGTYTLAAYLPIYFNRAFPQNDAEFSVSNACAILLGGGASSYLGGFLADRWASQSPSILAWLPGLGGLLALFPMWLVMYSQSFVLSMSALGLQFLLAECWLGPAMTLLQQLLQPHGEVMSTAVALLLFANTMMSSVAPSLIAWADPGTEDVRFVFMLVMSVSYGGSFILFTILALQMHHQQNDTLEKIEKMPLLQQGALLGSQGQETVGGPTLDPTLSPNMGSSPPTLHRRNKSRIELHGIYDSAPIASYAPV